jgi:hypothetical protein
MIFNARDEDILPISLVVPRLCKVAQPLVLSDEQIISLIYLPKLLKRVPRVCKVAQPLCLVEKQQKTPAFPLSQGCAKLHSLYFRPKTAKNAGFPLSQGGAKLHSLFFCLAGS